MDPVNVTEEPEVFIARPGSFAMLARYINEAMEEDGMLEPEEPDVRLIHDHMLLPYQTALTHG